MWDWLKECYDQGLITMEEIDHFLVDDVACYELWMEYNVDIPILGNDRNNLYRTFEWHEEETIDDFFKRHGSRNEMLSCWSRVCVWAKNDTEEPDGTFQCVSYEVEDIRSERLYLILPCDFTSPEDIYSAVVIPRHRLNLIKFYKEFLLPFSDANFFHG